MPRNARPELGDPNIVAAQRRYREALGDLKIIIADKQKRCTHQHMLEADYQKLHGDGGLPPMRVCCNCGMSEEGWGSGYRVLVDGELKGPLESRRTVQRASRDDVYALRAGLHIHDAHKGPLIRREVTIAQLIDGLLKEQREAAD